MINKSLPVSPGLLSSLAARYGTPLYVYHAPTIRRRCRELTGAFSGLPVSWLYAMKANDNPFLLDLIRGEGFGFDTVSPEEMELALATGSPTSSIILTENNMSDEEMAYAINRGVLINIGSYSRFEAFCRQAAADSCSIRIKPDIGDGHHARVDTGNRESKFGIQLDLLGEAARLASASGKTVRGLHFHIGSGIRSADRFIQAMEVLFEASRQFPALEFLNFGGGFPTPYKPADHAFDLVQFTRRIGQRLKLDLATRPAGFRYFFEPGRWLVAESGVLVSEVTAVKTQGQVHYIGTNTGFNHLVRPAMYDAYHHIENITAGPERPLVTYTVSGNICESGDVLGVGRLLPEARTGDLLALHDTGAYGMSMASMYNRRRLPPEILVEENGTERLIRPRAGIRDATAAYLAETGYRPGK